MPVVSAQYITVPGVCPDLTFAFARRQLAMCMGAPSVPKGDQSDHFAMCARMVLTNAHEVAIRTPPVAASPDAAAELRSLSPICTPRKMLPKHRVHSAPHTTQNHPVAMPPLNILVPWPLHGHHILY